MTRRHPIFRLLPLCLLAAVVPGTVPTATAAQPTIASLMLHARDLGPGYSDSNSGYEAWRCNVMEPGIPVEFKLIQQHGFVRDYFTGIVSRQKVTGSPVLAIGELACQFATATGAHWAFVHMKTTTFPDRPGDRQIAMGHAGEESFGSLPRGAPNDYREIVFRQGRYLVALGVAHRPPQPQRAVALARLVAARIAQNG